MHGGRRWLQTLRLLACAAFRPTNAEDLVNHNNFGCHPAAQCVHLPFPAGALAGSTKLGAVGLVTMVGNDVNVEDADIIFIEDVSSLAGRAGQGGAGRRLKAAEETAEQGGSSAGGRSSVAGMRLPLVADTSLAHAPCPPAAQSGKLVNGDSAHNQHDLLTCLHVVPSPCRTASW